MTKFVMLGSCRFAPYDFLAVPNKIPGAWNTDKGYAIASKIFYPAMDEADLILVYAPDGIGEHTQKDIDYARSIGKKIYELTEAGEESSEFTSCEECDCYIAPDYEGDWQCTYSHCIHHISSDDFFSKRAEK